MEMPKVTERVAMKRRTMEAVEIDQELGTVFVYTMSGSPMRLLP
jgi:hypothetical protein